MTAPIILSNLLKVAALAYARQGMPVFPVHHVMGEICSCGKVSCESPAKHPLTPNGFHDATTEPEVIEAWWTQWPGANIGLPTGGRSGIVVVDIDPKHGGADAWAEILSTHGRADTLSVRTGGGGNHLVFQAPPARLKSKSGGIAKGVDTRAEGGYIVAPPSVHISGQRYEWTKKVPPAPLPGWLLEMWAVQNGGDAGTAAPNAREIIPEGERNNYLTKLAGAMRRQGASVDSILPAIKAENVGRCAPPLDDREVEGMPRASGDTLRPAPTGMAPWPRTSPLTYQVLN